jgi:hypothetical protein
LHATVHVESGASDRPRVAYLILSHTLPRQVLRLASLLRGASPDAAILSHHDDRSSSLDRGQLGALDVQRIEPPGAIGWGEYSLLAGELRCLRWALEHAEFDWLVLISGQDYPIRPVADIERSLALADVDAFVEANECPRPALGALTGEFAGRYYFHWRPLPAYVPIAPLRAAARQGRFVRVRVNPRGRWLGVRALRAPFGAALRCYFGAEWFNVSRSAVEAVLRFADSRPEVLAHYRRTWNPSESFIQTVLANDPRLRISGDIRRYTVWDGPQATSPSILTLDHLEGLLRSGCDFARKFDETVDSAVLDEIDSRFHLPPS